MNEQFFIKTEATAAKKINQLSSFLTLGKCAIGNEHLAYHEHTTMGKSKEKHYVKDPCTITHLFRRQIWLHFYKNVQLLLNQEFEGYCLIDWTKATKFPEQ